MTDWFPSVELTYEQADAAACLFNEAAGYVAGLCGWRSEDGPLEQWQAEQRHRVDIVDRFLFAAQFVSPTRRALLAVDAERRAESKVSP